MKADVPRARERLQQERAAWKAEASSLVAALRNPSTLESSIRGRLVRMARSCYQLGDYAVAEALRTVASASTSSEDNAKDVTVQLASDKRREYQLLRLDEEIRIPVGATEVARGALPAAIQVETGASYLVLIETDSTEPCVAVPIARGGSRGEMPTVDIDLTPWRGLGSSFVLLPRMEAAVGGDLAARDSLSERTVEIGPIAIARWHVRMGDYLDILARSGEALSNPHLVPAYMGEPLVEGEPGRWKPGRLPVRAGHDWLRVPAVGVDFSCAEWYCSRFSVPRNLVAGLLHETEWEVAARGPDGRLFPWGDRMIEGFANIRQSATADEGLEVAGYRDADCSAAGLFDCSGNVEEWCQLDAQTGGDGRYAVTRGGSWYNPPQAARLASRVVRHRDYRHKKLSFRVVVRLR